MTLFFLNDTDSNLLTLPQEESKHCVKVLRMGAGEELYITNGNGTMCRCRILSPDAKGCVVEVVDRKTDYGRRSHYLHIAVAPTKNTARLEWFVEKAVETGIDEITPIMCDHSERTTLKTERLDKIVVSAMKQSLKAYKPRINEPVRLTDFLDTRFPDPFAKLICHCDGDHRTPLREVCHKGDNALVLIGPEGDFSEREIDKALSNGFQPVTLGDCRLRTETAALYATIAINFLNT